MRNNRDDHDNPHKAWTKRKLDLLTAIAADPNVGGGGFRTAFAILQHFNAETKQCNPSQELLAIETATTARAVRKNIRILEDAGWLYVYRRSRNVTNLYIFKESNVPAALGRLASLKAALREEQSLARTERNSRASLLMDFPVPVPSGTYDPVESGSELPPNTITEVGKRTR